MTYNNPLHLTAVVGPGEAFGLPLARRRWAGALDAYRTMKGGHREARDYGRRYSRDGGCPFAAIARSRRGSGDGGWHRHSDMGERCRVCGVGRVGDRALARGTKKWVRISTHPINCLELLERPAPRLCQGSGRLGVSVAVNSGSGAACGPGAHLSGTGGV